MCIICFKPADVPFPDKKVLSTCWDNNHDGGGYMFRVDKMVIGKKGFMEKKRFIGELTSKRKELEPLEVVIHFRWATHGLRDHTATHPFPLSIDVKELTRMNWEAPSGIAHNGIVSNYGYSNDEDLSDTQEFIALDLGWFGKLADRPEVADYIKSKGGKWALMSANRTTLIGDFLSDHGCYWSNADYKEGQKWEWYYHKKPSRYKKRYGFDDYDNWKGINRPRNTDYCPRTGLESCFEQCEACTEFDIYDNSCSLAYSFRA